VHLRIEIGGMHSHSQAGARGASASIQLRKSSHSRAFKEPGMLVQRTMSPAGALPTNRSMCSSDMCSRSQGLGFGDCSAPIGGFNLEALPCTEKWKLEGDSYCGACSCQKGGLMFLDASPLLKMLLPVPLHFSVYTRTACALRCARILSYFLLIAEQLLFFLLAVLQITWYC